MVCFHYCKEQEYLFYGIVVQGRQEEVSRDWKGHEGGFWDPDNVLFCDFRHGILMCSFCDNSSNCAIMILCIFMCIDR